MLRERMKKYSDYDEIKEELNIMKSIEFSTGETLEEDSTLAPYSSAQSVSKLLSEKNKKLQTELMSAKIIFEESQLELHSLQSELGSLRSKSIQQSALIQRLEDDLQNVNTFNPDRPNSGESLSNDPLTALEAKPPSVIDAMSLRTPTTQNSTTKSFQTTISADTSIIPILTSQRDRFRVRNEELEKTNRTQTSTISDLQNELEQLKSDNVKMYEKLRFAQLYSSVPAPTPTSTSDIAATRRPTHNDKKHDDAVHINLEPDVTNKYKAVYEGNLDPFQRFHRQEEARKVSGLSTAERATLRLFRLVVGNKHTRWIFVVYVLSLHALVLVTLLKLSMWEECRH
ncbi:hypothetical protein HK096_010962, partial [Nowakowskiella sp. JEL0078]